MTKEELIKALDQLPGNAEIEVWIKACRFLRRRPYGVKIEHELGKEFGVIKVEKRATAWHRNQE